jgi:YD repeat-containing protein
VTTPAGVAWTLGYDTQGRLTSLTSPAAGTLGQPGYTPPYTTSFTYGQTQTVVLAGAGTSAALPLTYTLDAQGQAITVTDGLSHATQYTYDACGQA